MAEFWGVQTSIVPSLMTIFDNIPDSCLVSPSVTWKGLAL